MSGIGERLVAGALLAAGAVLLAERRWRRRRSLVRTALGASPLPGREYLRGGFVVAAAALLGSAAAAPVRPWRPAAPPVPRGIPRADVVLVLDVSRSMTVADVTPSRWEEARTAALAVAASARDSRVGIVAFAADAHVLLPPTTDPSLAILYLNALDPQVTTAQGSNLARALDVSLRAFQADASPSGVRRSVVFFTDGEGFQDASDLEASLTKARRDGVSVSAVMVGTEAGGTVPGIPGGRSSASPVILRRMARATDGRMVDASSTGVLGTAVRDVTEPVPAAPPSPSLPMSATVALAALALVLLLSETAWGMLAPEGGR